AQVKLGAGADLDRERRKMERRVALSLKADQRSARLVADLQLQRGVRLIGNTVRPLECLDDIRLRALADHAEAARERGCGVPAGEDVADMDRPLGRTALPDL